MIPQIQEIFANPEASALVILNLIIIESLLSVDNATVLAIMVKDLPEQERKRALRIGIWCAYIFRGIAMLFAAQLMQIWWLKFLGGMYLNGFVEKGRCKKMMIFWQNKKAVFSSL